jgi:hypothetical protein
MAVKIKTDDWALVGKHAFEAAGLGVAPFRFVRVDRMHTSCQFCGTGIMYRFFVRGADGREFFVGSDCINRTGDHGLIQSYKMHPDYRKLLRDKAKAKDDAIIMEWNALLADPKAAAALTAKRVPDPRYWLQRDPDGCRPWLEQAKWAWGGCGAAGRARYLKAAKQIVKEFA